MATQPIVSIAFLDELTDRVRHGLEERLTVLVEHGHSLAELGAPAELADRMLAVVPAPSRWDDLLGPFYTTAEVAKRLGGISRQALADRRERRTILALKTADGVLVYPAFQFADGGHQVVAGLAEVLQAFRGSEVDEWTLAGWLVAPSRALGGRSVIDWLRDGRDLAAALTLARDASRRFSR
jgi:hypothetical protein